MLIEVIVLLIASYVPWRGRTKIKRIIVSYKVNFLVDTFLRVHFANDLFDWIETTISKEVDQIVIVFLLVGIDNVRMEVDVTVPAI